MKVRTETLRKSLGASADVARLWLESHTKPISRATFHKKGKIEDTKVGAVYAYYGQDGEALYVGQTGRSVKARLHDQTDLALISRTPG